MLLAFTAQNGRSAAAAFLYLHCTQCYNAIMIACFFEYNHCMYGVGSFGGFGGFKGIPSKGVFFCTYRDQSRSKAVEYNMQYAFGASLPLADWPKQRQAGLLDRRTEASTGSRG